MSAKKANAGGSARAVLGRGSRQVQEGAAEGAAEATTSTPPARPSPARTGVRRGKTKRITVDLPRDEHKFLRDYAYDHDADGMRVVRALLLELAEDPGLSERVGRRLPTVSR